MGWGFRCTEPGPLRVAVRLIAFGAPAVNLLVLWCVVLLGVALVYTGIDKLMQGHVSMGLVLLVIGVLLAGLIVVAVRSAYRWLQALFER